MPLYSREDYVIMTKLTYRCRMRLQTILPHQLFAFRAPNLFQIK